MAELWALKENEWTMKGSQERDHWLSTEVTSLNGSLSLLDFMLH